MLSTDNWDNSQIKYNKTTKPLKYECLWNNSE